MSGFEDPFCEADFPTTETGFQLPPFDLPKGFDHGPEDHSALGNLIGKLRENYDFFKGMSDKEIVWILRLCGRRAYKPDQVIFQEGEFGSCFYLIVFGKVVICRGKTVLAKLETGECFGEMAVLEDEPRSATAKAAADTLVISIERDILTDVFPALGFKVAANLAKQLSIKLREMDKRIKVTGTS